MYIKLYKYFITISIFVFSFGAFTTLTNNYEKVLVSDLSKSVIRFHVLANSDNADDQLLKMKVKEAVVNYMQENMTNVKNTDEAAEFLVNNTQKITAIATKIINDNGYDYNVSAHLGNSAFPDKTYGDVTFPAGNYNSYIVKIGKAEGHNWWCVLYPPLCFVDASTGILPEESKETLKSSISENEYDYLTTSSESGSDLHSDAVSDSTYDTSSDAVSDASSDSGSNIKYEFKLLNLLKDLLN